MTTIPEVRAEHGLAEVAERAKGRRVYAAITETERQALELLVAGATYPQIAKILGITPSRVSPLVTKALAKRAVEFNSYSRDQAFVIYYDRLEKMFARWFPLSLGGRIDPVTMEPLPPDPKAAQIAMGILDRMGKAMGFDAPIQVEAAVSVQEAVAKPEDMRRAILQSLQDMEARKLAGNTVVEGELVD